MNHRFILGAAAAVGSVKLTPAGAVSARGAVSLDRDGHRQLQPGARSLRINP
jgi:hypothetical protein